MKRLHVRVSLLTVVWVAVGIILFAVIWAFARGKSDATGGIAGVGFLIFIVSGAMLGSEVNLAIRALNLRIDERVRHSVSHGQRLKRLERHMPHDSGGRSPDDPPPAVLPGDGWEIPR